MKKIIDKYLFVIIGIGIVLVFVLGYIYSAIINKGIKKHSKYTVGYISSDWHYKNGNGVGTDYLYYVGNKEFSGTSVYNLKKGTKYLLMYDSLKEKNSILLGHHQLSNMISAPSKGWDFNKVPIKLDSVDLIKYSDELNME